MGTPEAAFAREATPLLQALIRNACVNDGTDGSGHEARNVDTLIAALEGPGIDIARYDVAPDRANLVARIEGRNPDAPTLLLHAKTDVVPASGGRWTHDPFGGELSDGRVWGRGSIDILNHAATIAVAMRQLADHGWRPEGTLIFAATADQERHSALGTRWLLDHHPEAIKCDFAITQTGGVVAPSPTGLLVVGIAGEKGSHWLRLDVTGDPVRPIFGFQGTALAKAAEVIVRLDRFTPGFEVHEFWREFVTRSGWAGPMDDLLDPERIDQAAAGLPPLLQRGLHTLASTTVSATRLTPGGIGAGDTTRTVSIEVNVRTLPGQTVDDAVAMVTEAIGDLAPDVEIVTLSSIDASSSPIDTPLWDTLGRLSRRWYPDSRLVPLMPPGTTDARFFREAGAIAYGFALYSEQFTLSDILTMFEDDDEWCDVESLGLTTAFWLALARDLLGD